MEKPYKINKLENAQDIERLDNLLTILFANMQTIKHRVSDTTPVVEQLREGEILFLDDGSGNRQLYAKIKNTLYRVPKVSTDGTLANNSDNLFPTEKAVKTYVDGIDKFTERTGATDYDYHETGDKSVIDTDGDTHDLDLGSGGLGVVPTTATAVLLRVTVQDDVENSYIRFFKKGSSDTGYNIAEAVTQVGSVPITYDLTVPCDSSGRISYIGENLAFQNIWIVVRGWWQ